jgi:hypothetical protein
MGFLDDGLLCVAVKVIEGHRRESGIVTAIDVVLILIGLAGG